MVESYLHKMAKELLYKEIEEKSGFEYKLSDDISDFESLISREDYRGECVLMEFPTKEGYYPDEFGCSAEPAWDIVYASMPYDIFFVKAEDVLKRVDSTPVFVYNIVGTSDPK